MEIDQNEKSENYEYDGDNKDIKSGVPIEHLQHTTMPNKNLLYRNNTPHWTDKSPNKIINNRRTRLLNHDVNNITRINLKKKQDKAIANNSNNNINNNNNNNKKVLNINRNKPNNNNNKRINSKNIKINNITNSKEQFLNSKNKLLNNNNNINNNNSRNMSLRGNVRTLNASLSGSSKSKALISSWQIHIDGRTRRRLAINKVRQMTYKF